jgi:hypothetical protein
MVQISTHVDIKFFTQNKLVNNHQTSSRCFVGHSIYVRCQVGFRSSNSAHISQSSVWPVGDGAWEVYKKVRKCALHYLLTRVLLPSAVHV